MKRTAEQRTTLVDTGNRIVLVRIVTQALAEAREKGLDHIGQTDHAIRAVLAARPDMTASDAMWQVERLQRG